MATHTPTPYKATHIGEDEFRKEIIIDVATCGQVAEVLDAGNGKETAEFVVRACNNFATLVEALERCIESDSGIEDELTAYARAALAAAKGE
jgi:hypothetical protein